MADKKQSILQFLEKIRQAGKESTKKELFKDLLNRLYADETEIIKIIDAISSGAETTVLNIPRKGKVHTGRADTLYNNVIIEFENDLNKTLNHAKEQLAGYLLGQFRSGKGYEYTLIASDFITWKVFSPDLSCLEHLNSLSEHELILNEVLSASFVLSEDNAEDFYYYIDRFLFKEEKRLATLNDIKEAFGAHSNIFLECFRILQQHFSEAKKIGEVQVSLEQWQNFLSIAYGSYNASEQNFLIHSYLSVFAKMLAYSIVSNDDYIEEKEMRGILDGSIFNRYHIQNFADNDFYHWVANERSIHKLKQVFRLIAQEISTFNFNQVSEDILKGVYQELIDLDTRHTLGEYYTPDWLCELILSEFVFTENEKILDPSCGSGSFLRAFVHRIKELHPQQSIEEINNRIFGIDIHPLSVQIAKTTLLLAYGKDVVKARKPIHLNVSLANTLLTPEGISNLWGNEFTLSIDKDKLILNTQVFDDDALFVEAMEVCEQLAEQTLHKKKDSVETFGAILKARHKKGGFNGQIIESFYKIYESLKKAKEKGRDSIWKFIVLNLYKPYFLSKKFDYVIGNPPWFTYSSVKNQEYQNTLNAIAIKYDIKPDRVANYPHLEIAAIFLAYCSNYFLKESGKTAFVLPRSFFYSDSHDNTRSGKAKGFKISSIWDLKDVSPLFRVPSSVLFAMPAAEKRNIGKEGISGKLLKGKLPEHNCNIDLAKKHLSFSETKWYYTKQGTSSAYTTQKKAKPKQRVNIYKKAFKQGATIVPRCFYFVQISQETPPDFTNRIINIKTSESVQADAKAPWKNYHFEDKLESNFLFFTALSRSILPFALYKPDLVALPIQIESNPQSGKKIKVLSPDELRKQGYLYASKWFTNAENIWNMLKTERSKNMSSNNRLDFHRGLSEQNLNAKYLVVYNSSAKDANATIINREDLDLEFIVESKAYWFGTQLKEEACYLAAILNSSIPNLLMKDFQTKGLFGPRDIHKKILDIYFPKFDAKNEKHKQLAAISESAHTRAKAYLQENPPEMPLTKHRLGRLRLNVKEHLSEEMKEIDKIVKKLLQ